MPPAARRIAMAILARTRLPSSCRACLHAENLHPAILPVGDIQFAVAIEGNPGGQEELSRGVPGVAEGEQNLPIGVIGLHAVISAFHHQDSPLRINGDAFWLVEGARKISGTAKSGEELAG